MEGVLGSDHSADRGFGKIPLCTSRLLGGSGIGYHLPQSQVASESDFNEVLGNL